MTGDKRMGKYLFTRLKVTKPYDEKDCNQSPGSSVKYIPLLSNELTMYICQWSLEIVFGKQKQALDIMKEWGAEKFRSSRFKKSKNRVYVGHIGESPSLIIDEYEFEQLEDFTAALAEMGQPQFRQFSEAIAPFIVSGTQKWKVFRVIS